MFHSMERGTRRREDLDDDLSLSLCRLVLKYGYPLPPLNR